VGLEHADGTRNYLLDLDVDAIHMLAPKPRDRPTPTYGLTELPATTPHPYTPEQTFARDLLIAAINGGINRWARVHGYSIDVPADQVRAEGVDTADRAIWTVTLADLQAAMNKLVADPHRYTSSDTPAGTSLERVQAAVATIRAAYAKLPPG
jgi:hypothetical protein